MRTKRIALIENYIEQEKSVSLDTLCEKFQVSKNTIRRDIDNLSKKGTVQKVYGGVTYNLPASDARLLPYEQRHTVARKKTPFPKSSLLCTSRGYHLYRHRDHLPEYGGLSVALRLYGHHQQPADICKISAFPESPGHLPTEHSEPGHPLLCRWGDSWLSEDFQYHQGFHGLHRRYHCKRSH